MWRMSFANDKSTRTPTEITRSLARSLISLIAIEMTTNQTKKTHSLKINSTFSQWTQATDQCACVILGKQIEERSSQHKQQEIKAF